MSNTKGYFESMREAGKSMEEIIPLSWERYLTLLNQIKSDPPVTGVKTPFPLMNHMTGGLEDGRLYILGAPPKQGKTNLAMSYMYGMAKSGTKSLFFSYEVDWKSVVRQFAKMEESDGLTPGTIDLPIFLPIELHRGGDKLQLQWLREAIERAKSEGIQFVVIDYLHFLIPYQMTENFSIVVGNVVREIKRIALDVGIPVMLIVAMKNLQTDRPPTVWDIRDSSMIMHEADDIMVMYRLRKSQAEKLTNLGSFKEKKRPTEIDTEEEHEDPFSQISILKLEMSRKNGASGTVYLGHNGAYFKQVDKADIGAYL